MKRMKVIYLCVLSSGIGHWGTSPAAEAQAPKPAACAAAEYRQFDFWVGDWDAFESGGSTPVARVRVDRVLEGCALLEQYEDTNGLKGQSFSMYDASRKV